MRDLVSRYRDLHNKATSVVAVYNTQEKLLEGKREQLESIKVEVDNNLSDIELYNSVIVTLRQLLDNISTGRLQGIRDFVNYSLRVVFLDKDYEVDFEIGEYRNQRTLEIYLIEHKMDDVGEVEVIRSNIKDEVGGGIRVIVGAVIQIYFIILNRLRPILFMDESLSALSTNYIENFYKLLKLFSDKYGFMFLSVTHDPRFEDDCVAKYRVQDGYVRKVD